MTLSNKDIEEFQKLWREEFKEEISADDARQRAHELLEFYAVLAKAPWVETSDGRPPSTS
jgi:predicted transcriptional regulator YdeE